MKHPSYVKQKEKQRNIWGGGGGEGGGGGGGGRPVLQDQRKP